MKRKEEPIPDFDAMTPGQRLRCHFAVWESMDRHGECESAVPDRHTEVVNERVAEYKTGKVKMMTPEEAKAAPGVRPSYEEGSDWEDEIALDRLRRMESGEAELLTLEEFEKRLRERWAAK